MAVLAPLSGISFPCATMQQHGGIVRRIARDDILEHAAALSYYFVFALFPALLFLTTLGALAPRSDLMQALLGYGEAQTHGQPRDGSFRPLPGGACLLVAENRAPDLGVLRRTPLTSRRVD